MDRSAVTSAHLAGIDHLILTCGRMQPGETAVVLCDERTRLLGILFGERIAALGGQPTVFEMPYSPTHGTEPPDPVVVAMEQTKLIFGLTSTSKAHSNARRRACAAGGRYLSMPEYSLDLLLDPSIRADYPVRAEVVRRVSDIFTAGQSVRVTTPLGTDIRLNIAGRIGNACPGYVDVPGALGSPPDIEANVSPVETDSEGVVVVDGSIPCPEIGLLSSPVTLEVRHGRIVRFSGRDQAVIATLERMFQAVGSDKAYVLAECGVGLNDQAQITGAMLTDEGANGHMHFGIGSNATVGGQNDVPFHLDFVFKQPTLDVDGQIVLLNGLPVV